MSRVLEIVKFTVKPGQEDVFFADRPAFVAAMKRNYPGVQFLSLARLEGNLFVEVAAWESREAAEKAAMHCMENAEMAPFFAPLDQTVSLEFADVIA